METSSDAREQEYTWDHPQQMDRNRGLHEDTMTAYKTKSVAKIYSKPGLTPFIKQGNLTGELDPGETVEEWSNIRGWIAINSSRNRWIMASLCIKLEEYPPIDDEQEPPPIPGEGPELRWAVVKHPPWTDFASPGLSHLLPSAQKLHDNPRHKYKGATIRIFDNWKEYIRRINENNYKGFEFAWSTGSLWRNHPGEPFQAECILSGRNLVAWLVNDPGSETDQAVKILTYSHRLNTETLNVEYDNIFYKPHLYWMATAFNRAYETFKVWGGITCFIPQIKQYPCWIKKDNIVMKPRGWYPRLPADPETDWFNA